MTESPKLPLDNLDNTEAITGAERIRERYGLLSRFVDAMLEPSRLFRRLDKRRPWFDILILVVFLNGASTWALWQSDVGHRIIAESLAEDRDELKGRLTEKQFAYWEKHAPATVLSPFDLARSNAVSGFLTPFVFAFAIQFGLNFLLLRDTPYIVVLSILCHAASVTAVERVFLNVLTYLTGSPKFSALPQLLPMIAWPDGFVGNVISSLGVFTPWWIVVVSIGLAHVYERPRWSPMAAGFLMVWLLAAVSQALLHFNMPTVGHPRFL